MENFVALEPSSLAGGMTSPKLIDNRTLCPTLYWALVVVADSIVVLVKHVVEFQFFPCTFRTEVEKIVNMFACLLAKLYPYHKLYAHDTDFLMITGRHRRLLRNNTFFFAEGEIR